MFEFARFFHTIFKYKVNPVIAAMTCRDTVCDFIIRKSENNAA
jgi:hypothetical protein